MPFASLAGERSNLQPALGYDRLDLGGAELARRVWKIVHLGSIDFRLAAGPIEHAAEDECAAGVALDQQDRLAVAQQRGKCGCDCRLALATDHHNDDAGTLNDRGPVRAPLFKGS